MTDLSELNKNTPASGVGRREPAIDEASESHRRIEREANKAAERGKERQRADEPGEFSNVGPV